MSHRSSHRRTVVNPEAYPSPSLPLERKTHIRHGPAETTTSVIKSLTVDHSRPSQLLGRFSRLDLNNQWRGQERTKDIHQQAKAMTRSADSYVLTKPKMHMSHTTYSYGERKMPKKASLERRPRKDLLGAKSEKEVRVGVKKKEVCDSAVKRSDVKDQDGDFDETKRVSMSLLCRSRSLSGSKAELANILANCGVKIVSADMPPSMQIHAVDFARKTHDSLEKFSAKSLALNLKKEFDGVYGPAWHCIVGTSFGSFVTHSVGGFLYFSMDQKLYILLFKTSVQRAD